MRDIIICILGIAVVVMMVSISDLRQQVLKTQLDNDLLMKTYQKTCDDIAQCKRMCDTNIKLLSEGGWDAQ